MSKYNLRYNLLLLILLPITKCFDCEINSTSTFKSCISFCRVNYQGKKNYYNKQTKTCEPISLCKSNQTLNISDNICYEKSLVISYNKSLHFKTQLNNISTSQTTVNCVNGYYLPNVNLCVCYSGWISSNSISSNNSTINKCDIASSTNQTNTNQNEQDGANNNNTINEDLNELDDVNEEVIQEKHMISLILSIVIPSVLGLIGLIWLISFIIIKVKKRKQLQIEKERFKNNNNNNITLSNDIDYKKQNKCAQKEKVNNKAIVYQTPIKHNKHIHYYNTPDNKKSSFYEDQKSSFSFRFNEGNCYSIKDYYSMTTPREKNKHTNKDKQENINDFQHKILNTNPVPVNISQRLFSDNKRKTKPPRFQK